MGRCFDPDHWEVYWDYSAIEYSFEEDDNSDVKIDHIEEPSESSSPICQEELEDIIELVDKAICNSQSREPRISTSTRIFSSLSDEKEEKRKKDTVEHAKEVKMAKKILKADANKSDMKQVADCSKPMNQEKRKRIINDEKEEDDGDGDEPPEV